MKKPILICALLISNIIVFSNIKAQNNLERVYSSLLSANLNHCMDNAKTLYNLTSKNEFSKELVERELNNITKYVDDANLNISSMKQFYSKTELKQINKYIESIDEHLAQVYLDVKSIIQDLRNEKKISNKIFDLYSELKKAEQIDHKEMKRIRNIKAFNEL